jgi:hypothetical protein
LNGRRLHPNTRVFSAVNTAATYSVNEIDPALLDRFWAIDLAPDAKDWLAWARDPKQGNIHEDICGFIANNEAFLDPSPKTNLVEVQPSRRSWEKLNADLVAAGLMENPGDQMFYMMSLGYIGTEATIALHDYVKSVDNRISGKDVVENYSKVQAKVKRATIERQNALIETAADYVLKNVPGALSKKQGKNINSFIKDLPHELRLALWSKLMQDGIENLERAKSIHSYVVKEIVTDVFGVPLGEAGVGVQPNIPQMFNNSTDPEDNM